MKFFILLVCFCAIVKAEEVPTLRFDKDVTWENIFDSGFRPKHFEGSESTSCVCIDQSFWLQLQDREPKFKLEKGRIKFAFPIGEEVHMLWHQGLDAITLEEGKRRADEFRKLFEGYIIQEFTMPRLIDPSGLVDTDDTNNVKARVGKYLFIYGFDNSFGKAKPIIPHFYIALNYPGKPDYRVKPTTYRIKPPAGYEWYSLDPKVNTPDPVDLSKAKPTVPEEVVEKKPEPTVTKEPVSEEPTARPAKARPPQVIPLQREEPLWFWLAVIMVLLGIIGFSVKRYTANSKG
jgi:hypothetical protein